MITIGIEFDNLANITGETYRTTTQVPAPSRILARAQELTDKALHDSDNFTFKDDIEDDCIAHLIGANGIEAYSVAAAFAYEKGFDKVVDIGCACAHQAELFESLGLQYMGVEAVPIEGHMFTDNYIAAKYPCDIQTDKSTLGVSRLCVGYLIYGKEAYDSLYRDFDHLLISGPAAASLELRKRYSTAVKVPAGKENWFYYTKK